MKARVQLFAVARQIAGREWIELELPDAATVGQLRSALAAEVPALDRVMRHLMFAVNAEYAGENAVIPESAEIACIPPVSGG